MSNSDGEVINTYFVCGAADHESKFEATEKGGGLSKICLDGCENMSNSGPCVTKCAISVVNINSNMDIVS